MFAHRNVSWTVEQLGCIFSVTIAGFPVLDSAIGNRFFFTCFCRLSTNHTYLTCCNFVCQHSVMVETTVKQRAFAFIAFHFRSIGLSCFVYVAAIFSAVTMCRGFYRCTDRTLLWSMRCGYDVCRLDCRLCAGMCGKWLHNQGNSSYQRTTCFGLLTLRRANMGYEKYLYIWFSHFT